MPRRQPRVGSHWGAALVVLLATTAAAGGDPMRSAVPAQVRPLVEAIPAAGGLAAIASGQTVFIIDESTGGVIGCDPFAPETRWPALPAPAKPADGPAAIGCLDSTAVVTIARGAEGWELRSYRLQPPGADVGGLQPVSSQPLGKPVNTDHPLLAVGMSREWLVATGFDSPPRRMHLFGIRGGKTGAIGKRDVPDQRHAVAMAPLPDNGLAVFDTDGPAGDATARLAVYEGVQPRRLLALETGLPAVRAATASRSTGDLWVLAGTPGSSATPEGLWRIEARLEEGRQVAQAVCFATLEAPRSLVWISDRLLLVVHGNGKRVLSRVEPPAPAASASP